VKTVFIWPGCLAAALSACVDFDAQSGSGADDAALESSCIAGCGKGEHSLSGEVMLFVNGRFTAAEGLFQTNVPLDDDGSYIGSKIYLYDHDASCDGGGTDCRLVELGSLRLDERLGTTSLGDGSLRKFGLRELAWSPTQGLWSITYDVANDEWGIAELHVPGWREYGQEVAIDRYTIKPGDPQSPGTDPCYWQEAVSGLGFLGDRLLLGVRGMGGVGIPNNGMVYEVAYDVLRDQGWCEYENDTSHDPHYYACDVLCSPWSDFGPALGVSGDLEVSAAGDVELAMVRAENDAIMPLDRQAVFRIDAPSGDQPSVAQPTGLHADGVMPGFDIEGLARIDGVLYGIDVWGKVWLLDESGDAITVHEDLAVHFEDPEQSLRVRGATKVVVDASDG